MRSLLIIILIGLTQSLYGNHQPDSLLFKIDKRNQTIIGENHDKTKSLKEELEIVFQKKGLVLSDSLWQQIRSVIRTDSDGDSSLSVQIGNSKVKIGVIKSGATYAGPQKTFQMPNPKDEKTFQVKSDYTGKSLVINGDGKEEVKVGWNGIHIKDGKEEVHVDWNGVQVKEANGEETKVIWGQDTTKIHPKEKQLNLYNRKGLNFYLGLNGITGSQPEIQTAIYPPTYMETDANVKPLSSRYVYIEIARSATLKRYSKSALKLGYGLGIEWYNFMFDHNRVVQNRSNYTAFQPVFDANNQELRYTKNKLSVSYLTIPIMPYFSFPKSSTFQMIAVGGYISYRIDSWTKTIEEKNENLVKNSNNFNLNQFRYGLKAEFAIKNFPDIFFNYDLSPIFDVNRGPKMTGFSFGIKLF